MKTKKTSEYQRFVIRREKAFKDLHPIFKKLEKKYGKSELFYSMRKYIDIIQTKKRAEDKIKEKEAELERLKKELA